jgi:hypothetical protein
MTVRPIHVFASALAVMASLACSGADEAAPEGKVRAVVETLASPYQVTRINLTATPANVSQDLTYSSEGMFSGTIVVPIGEQTLTAKAFVGTKVVGVGTATVTVLENTSTDVFIRILDTTGPDADVDHGPMITTLTASNTNVLTGEAVSLTATAVDPDGDPITYVWSQTCAFGGFSSIEGASTTWSSSVPGACKLTVTASSKQFSDALSVSVVVFGTGAGGEGTTGAVNVSGVFIPNPRVSRMDVYSLCEVYRSGSDGSCRQTVYPTQRLGGRFDFSSLPVDADVNVTITDDCGGTAQLGSIYLGNGSAYFEWTAPSTEAVCLLTATVTRDGLQDSMSVAIRAAGCIDDRFEHADSRAAAAELGGVYQNSWTGLYANDDDWYRFQPHYPSVSVVLTTADAIAVELYSGTTLVASGTNRIQATTVTPNGEYYLRVRRGAAAATCGSQYDLAISYI